MRVIFFGSSGNRISKNPFNETCFIGNHHESLNSSVSCTNLFHQIEQYFVIDSTPPARILVLWYRLNYDSEWTQFRSGAKIRFFYMMKYLPSIWISRYRNQLGKYRHGIHLGIHFGINRLGKYQFSVSHLFIETNCTDTIYSCICYNIVDSERKHFRIFECVYFSPNAFGLFDHFVQTIWLLIRFPVKFVYPSTPNGFHFCHPSTETSYK